MLLMLCPHVSDLSIKWFLDLEIFFKLDHFDNIFDPFCQ